MSIWESQPAKGLYVAGVVVANLVLLPYHLIRYSLPAGRQHPQWSFQQSIMTELGRKFLWHSATVRVVTPFDLTPGNLGDRFVVIQPAEAARYTGVLASKPDINPGPVPAVWYPSATGTPLRDERTVLHIHGGCFVIMDARPADSAFCAETLHQALGAPVLMISYRLASNPGGAFPAALQDALSAYLYLRRAGVSAKNIVLSGDSCGANFALGLLRYLSGDEGKRAVGSDAPGALLLWSPWVDVASIRANPGLVDSHRNAPTDYLNSNVTGWGAHAIGTAEDVQSPYLTSLGHPFACPDTKLFYQFGGLETLFDQGNQSAKEMASVPGNTVEVWIEEYASHDIIFGGAVSGFAAEAVRSAQKANAFIS